MQRYYLPLPSGALLLTQNGTYTVEFAPTGSGVGPMTLQLETPVNGGTCLRHHSHR